MAVLAMKDAGRKQQVRKSPAFDRDNYIFIMSVCVCVPVGSHISRKITINSSETSALLKNTNAPRCTVHPRARNPRRGRTSVISTPRPVSSVTVVCRLETNGFFFPGLYIRILHAYLPKTVRQKIMRMSVRTIFDDRVRGTDDVLYADCASWSRDERWLLPLCEPDGW